MTISVLIPAYRADRFIQTALDSVSSQTAKNWELIVVEDGSRGDTESIVKAFSRKHPARRVVYDNLETNQGVGVARNRLLTLADGDFIAFLDADDIWMPTHLACLEQCLTSGCEFAVTGIEIRNVDLNQSAEYHLDFDDLKDPVNALFHKSIIQTCSSVMCTRAIVAQARGFDESLQIGEDWDLWFRIALLNPRFNSTRRITCSYFKHANSAMTRTLRVCEDTVKFYRKHLNIRRIPFRVRRRMLASSLETLGRFTTHKDKAVASASFKEALSLEPFRWRSWIGLFRSLT